MHETKVKPQLSILALISFASAFVIARLFTTISPDVVLIANGLHIHHFWYGLIMLSIGGWLGISYNSNRVNRLAAILFGAGGGLIGDEIGLLLTLGNYQAGITYTSVVLLLAVLSIIILVRRYSRIIAKDFTKFSREHGSLYVGAFIAVVSIAFAIESENILIIIFSSLAGVLGCIIILAYFVRRLKHFRFRR